MATTSGDATYALINQSVEKDPRYFDRYVSRRWMLWKYRAVIESKRCGDPEAALTHFQRCHRERLAKLVFSHNVSRPIIKRHGLDNPLWDSAEWYAQLGKRLDLKTHYPKARNGGYKKGHAYYPPKEQR